MSRGKARTVTRDEQMQSVVTEAIDLGYDVEIAPGGHLKFTHPLVATPVFTSQTPSDYYAAKRALGDLRRYHRQAVANARPSTKTHRTISKPPPPGEFDCGACRGRGTARPFPDAQSLADHMRREHPAPALEPDPAPAPETPMDTATDTTSAPSRPREARSQQDFAQDDLLLFCQMSTSEFGMDDVIREFNFIDSKKTRSVIHNRLNVLVHSDKYPLERVGRGRYLWSTPDEPPLAPDSDVTPPTPQAASSAPATPDDPTTTDGDAVPTPTDTTPATTDPAPAPTPPVAADTIEVAAGTLISCVVEAKDGRMLVKDERGQVFLATFEAI